jgi:two-component system sensor histidine kinase HydH
LADVKAAEAHTPAKENRFLLAAFLILSSGLALLAVFFFTGESRRAWILAEYEADRMASTLLEAYRDGGELDASILDPRVLGFGVYRSGSVVLRMGRAPLSLETDGLVNGFSYDARKRTLLLVRPLGMGFAPPGVQGLQGDPGMMRRGGQGMRAMGRGGSLYLLMDAGNLHRAILLFRMAAVFAPLFVAGVAALFLRLAASNRRYRRAAEERETLARLGEIAHTLAHEIRNPLSAMRIQTGLIRRRMPGGTARELDIIEEEIGRLTLLTRRIGDFLRNPRGNPERIDLGAFLRDMLPRFPWPVGTDGDLPDPVVLFDGDLLRSVIENLVRNAHESYGEESVPGSREVMVALAREGQRVILRVFDRGRGIPAGKAAAAFAPFVTDKVGGSGIGLSISRRFVEAAGGTLALFPREAGGTEARVVLPAAAHPEGGRA